jgi:hypothetical protein
MDQTYGLADLGAVRDAAARTDWAALRTAITSPGEYQDREARIRVAVDVLIRRWRGQVPPGLEEWSAQARHDSTVQLLRGAVETYRAWAVEASGFDGILDAAAGWLRRAAALAPQDPTPWVWMLDVAKGLRLGTGRVVAFRDEAASREPAHFVGHVKAIKALSATWKHPVEVMEEHAQKWTAEAPPGSLLPALVFVVNFERMEPSPWGSIGQPSILRDASARERASGAGDAMPMARCATRADFEAHNYAAAWFWLTHQRGRARRHFAALGGYRTPQPWHLVSWNPAISFAWARAESRLLSGRR